LTISEGSVKQPRSQESTRYAWSPLETCLFAGGCLPERHGAQPHYVPSGKKISKKAVSRASAKLVAMATQNRRTAAKAPNTLFGWKTTHAHSTAYAYSFRAGRTNVDRLIGRGDSATYTSRRRHLAVELPSRCALNISDRLSRGFAKIYFAEA